jgi:hypothetical protein
MGGLRMHDSFSEQVDLKPVPKNGLETWEVEGVQERANGEEKGKLCPSYKTGLALRECC